MFLIFRGVLVAMAHQDPEDSRTSDIGYLLGVTGIGIVINTIPVGIYLKLNYFKELCQGQVKSWEYPFVMIPVVVLILIVISTLLISFKTHNYLRNLHPEHFKNLPSNNVLTFIDTQLMCFFLILYFMTGCLFIILKFIDILSREYFILCLNLNQVIVNNVVICLIFPVYVILKTRRYLPRLWSDDSPLILENNDFYAVRLSQVSPQLAGGAD